MDTVNKFEGLSFPKLEAALGQIVISMFTTQNDKRRCVRVVPLDPQGSTQIWEADNLLQALFQAELDYPTQKSSVHGIFPVNEYHDSSMDWWIYSGGQITLRKDGTEIIGSIGCPNSAPFLRAIYPSMMEVLLSLEKAMCSLRTFALPKKQ